MSALADDMTTADVLEIVARMRGYAQYGTLGPTAFVTESDKPHDPRFYVSRDIESGEK